jgi:hypothetical protein
MLTSRATRWLAVALFAACAAGPATAAPQAGHGPATAKPATANEGHAAAEPKAAAEKAGPPAAKEGHTAAEPKPAAAEKAGPATAKDSQAVAEPSGPPSVVSVMKRIEAIKAQAAAKPATVPVAPSAGRQPPAVRMVWPGKTVAAGIRIAWPQPLVPQVPNRDLGVRLVW